MKWETLLQPCRIREKSTVQKTDNDQRSPFKKDFDTVCNCTGLRRLQDKAQVFPLEKRDFARTRLTHSIEVMSIAESLGVSAIDVIKEIETSAKIDESTLLHIPVILRAAALLHDMGNPPFGHIGENIIAEWFSENLDKIRFDKNYNVSYKEQGDKDRQISYILSKEHIADFEAFEGNAQLLRLVSKLSFVTDENGMNLTFPILATVIKYPSSAIQCITAKKKQQQTLFTKKPGYFCSEQNLYNQINERLELNGKRYPLTYLLEAADDIAYLTADIEDAQKKGIISLHDIESYFNDDKYLEDEFVQSIKNAICNYREFGKSIGYEDLENYIMQRLRVFIKGNMISEVKVSFKENYRSIMNGTYNNELLLDSKVANAVKIIRNIEKDYIYYCKEIVQSKIEAHKIISCLLENFVLSAFNAKNNGKKDNRDNLIYNLFSTNYKFICNSTITKNDYKENEDDYIYTKLQLVTDVICGMTDSYALDIYKMLVALV